MDWDLKMPPWNLEEEIDRDAGLCIGSVVDCSVDLKLGRLGEFDSSNKWNETAAAAPMGRLPPPPPPGPPKRPPAAPANGGSHCSSCLVDGCMADLRKCREYHRRHKVCEAHSKTPVVVVRGQEQRFCQQCSRFHLLEEFDEVKRSCRKRLDGHNRRRRKPQPNSGNLFPDYQVTGLSSCSQRFPTSAPDSNWTSKMVKTEDNTTLYSHPQLIGYQHFPNPPYLFGKERKHITFFQDGGETSKSSSVGQLNLRTTPLSRSGGRSSAQMSNDGLNRVFNSDCALSLLSSSARASDIDNFSSVVPAAADQIPLAQPLVAGLQYGGLAIGSSVTPTGFSCAGEQSMGTVLASSDHGADDGEINCPGIFQVGGAEGPSDAAACMTLPFSWP